MNADPTEGVVSAVTVSSPALWLWLAIPATVLVLASLLSIPFRPGDRARSALQHLAGGIILAAVATELVPSLVTPTLSFAVWPGFAIGALLFIGMRVWDEKFSKNGDKGRGVSLAMMGTYGVDMAIDGMLVGIALVLTKSGGAMLSIALTLEVLVLGLALGATLKRPRTIVLVGVILGLVVLVSGVIGASAAGSLTGSWRIAVLAFGTAGLLFLAVEELLASAHENGETTIGTLLFFVGFGGGLALTMLEA
jgi:ZIP family zinc transporter